MKAFWGLGLLMVFLASAAHADLESRVDTLETKVAQLEIAAPGSASAVFSKSGENLDVHVIDAEGYRYSEAFLIGNIPMVEAMATYYSKKFESYRSNQQVALCVCDDPKRVVKAPCQQFRLLVYWLTRRGIQLSSIADLGTYDGKLNGAACYEKMKKFESVAKWGNVGS